MLLTLQYIQQGSVFWTDETEANAADCILKFVEIDEEIPFSALDSDTEEHTAVVLTAIQNGEGGPVKSYAEYLASQLPTEIETNNITFADLSTQILALNPAANLPTEADINQDGNTTLEEMQQYLTLLKQQALEAKFT